MGKRKRESRDQRRWELSLRGAVVSMKLPPERRRDRALEREMAAYRESNPEWDRELDRQAAEHASRKLGLGSKAGA